MKHFLFALMGFFLLSSCAAKITYQEFSAEFPGGFNGFRAKIIEKINTEAIDGDGVISSTARFIVEADGKIKVHKIEGDNESFNREIERVIMSIEGWQPAKKVTYRRGKIIKEEHFQTRYSLPLKMAFE